MRVSQQQHEANKVYLFTAEPHCFPVRIARSSLVQDHGVEVRIDGRFVRTAMHIGHKTENAGESLGSWYQSRHHPNIETRGANVFNLALLDQGS
jgi:hypothetical protein